MFAEEGFIFPRGIVQLRQGIVALVNDSDAHITILLRRLGSMYLEQLAALQRWIDERASEIAKIFKRNESCRRLATVPGIGPLVATALVSGVGDPLQFKNGRQFGAWLGLTPKQRSSGEVEAGRHNKTWRHLSPHPAGTGSACGDALRRAS
jgi:transposase